MWSRAGSGEATMQGMEGNLLGRGNCRTNPPQTPQKNQMLRRNSAKVRRHSLKSILSLLSLCCEDFTQMHIKAVYACAFSQAFVYLFVSCVGVC